MRNFENIKDVNGNIKGSFVEGNKCEMPQGYTME